MAPKEEAAASSTANVVVAARDGSPAAEDAGAAPVIHIEGILAEIATGLDAKCEETPEELGLGTPITPSPSKKRPLSPKVIRLLGDPSLFPEKVQKVLGVNELSSSASRRVFGEREAAFALGQKKRREAIERTCAARPSAEQLALPRPNERVSDKALRMLGEPCLREASQRVVTDQERKTARAHPKVVKLLGEPEVSSQIACKRLGSDMTSSQRKAQLQDQRAARERLAAEGRRLLEKRLKAQPSAEQLRLPHEQQPVSDKALRFFGEPLLEELSKKVVTPEMRKNVNPKTLRLLGPSAELLSKKQLQLLGENPEYLAQSQNKPGLWMMLRANVPTFVSAW